MKKLILLSALVLFFIVEINAQQINTKQWNLIHERTADWCPLCGTWGWDLKTKLIDKFQTKNVVFMAVHPSGGLSNPTSIELGNNFSGSGHPRFYIDGSDMNALSSNVNVKVAEAETVVDFIATQPAFAGIGLEAELSTANSNTLKVNAAVEFLTDVEGGDYSLGLYLLETVNGYQESRSMNETHKFVLRNKITSNTFGNALKAGAIKKGEKFSFTASLPNVNPDRSKLKVVGIIWNKVNGKYIFFNAFQVNVGIPASTFDTELSENMNVFQTYNGNIVLDLISKKEMKNINLNVSDLSGKLILTKSIASVDAGNQRFELEGSFIPGIHVVSFIDGNTVVSKKLFVK